MVKYKELTILKQGLAAHEPLRTNLWRGYDIRFHVHSKLVSPSLAIGVSVVSLLEMVERNLVSGRTSSLPLQVSTHQATAPLGLLTSRIIAQNRNL